MKRKILPIYFDLIKLLDYDPITGIFRHKFRKGSDKHTNRFNTLFAGKEIRTTDSYLTIYLYGKPYAAHRLAWLHYYGEDPGEMEVDHINSKNFDNRICNLRLANVSENNCNTKRFKSLNGNQLIRPYKGVQKTKNGKWQVTVNKNKKCHYFGQYDDLEEAIAIRDKEALRLHKEFYKEENKITDQDLRILDQIAKGE